MTGKELTYWVATPTGWGMDPEYCASLVPTLRYLVENGYRWPRYINGVASDVQNLHNILQVAHQFQDGEHGIFWCGADHSWTPGDFCRIIDAAAANPQAVVGALYPMAHGPNAEGNFFAGEAASDADATQDVVKAKYLGWGFIYTPFSVFEILKPPYWEWIHRDHPGAWKGMILAPDREFSERCQKAGIQVLLHRRCVDVGHGQRPGHKTSRTLLQEMGRL